MKKIMFIMTKLGGIGWGGAYKVSMMLANHFAKCGYDVSFAVSEDGQADYPLDDFIKVFNLSERYKSSKIRLVNLLKKMMAFRSLCKAEEIDIVVGFTSNMAIYAVLASIFSKRKSLISERTDPRLEPRKKIYRGIRNVMFSLADRIVFQTPGARDYYPNSVKKKSCIIPNPISDILIQAYHGEREKRIVNFCRLAPQKNLEVLLNAFDIFACDHKDYTLEIYGDGKDGDTYASKIKDFSQTLKSKDKIHFYGACRDVHEKVVKARAFASSSDYEGLSNSMLEAMAIGLPVIVTDCKNGGERMCINNGENGLIVPLRNPEALAQAMSMVADDDELTNRLSVNAAEIRDRFSFDNIFSMWDDQIHRLT